MITANFDGSLKNSRMYVGYVIFDHDGSLLHKHGEALEDTPATVNIAEFKALNQLLEYCLTNGITKINICGDSDTVINYVLGIYVSKKPHLMSETLKAQNLIRNFQKFDIKHISREDKRQKMADKECRGQWE